MKADQNPGFPGGSRGKVNRAGESLRRGVATAAQSDVVDDWRAAHRAVLNTFQAILRTRTRDTDIVVAQRHKRRSTIEGKLRRYPKMQLSRMDDVAGCRLIFPDIKSLREFRKNFHRARFHHKLKNHKDKYDYIESPKSTGYRGIHDVYSYDVNSQSGRTLKGLLVEIQYRTIIQHAWATAIEVIGFITESQPKFEEGDTRYRKAMALASEILARASENCRGPHPDKSDEEVVREFLKIDEELGLLKMLWGLNAADTAVSAKRNTILIFDEEGNLKIRAFQDAPEALRTLFERAARKQPRHSLGQSGHVRTDSLCLQELLYRCEGLHSISRKGMREAIWKEPSGPLERVETRRDGPKKPNPAYAASRVADLRRWAELKGKPYEK